jgi:hypothetical protein
LTLAGWDGLQSRGRIAAGDEAGFRNAAGRVRESNLGELRERVWVWVFGGEGFFLSNGHILLV